jgi:8-oxo-dGTP diphosphatase
MTRASTPHSEPDPNALLEARLEGWSPELTGTLLFVKDGERLLLMHKKRGHGAGRINGPGGKLEPGERPVDCAIRETLEETGITALNPELRGIFKFVDLKAPQWLGYIFVATRYEGAPMETEEGLPFWCALPEIPYARMWEDDRHWLPRVLAGERLEGEFLFDDGHLLAHRLRSAG